MNYQIFGYLGDPIPQWVLLLFRSVISIVNKPDWKTKAHNEEIATKWSSELGLEFIVDEILDQYSEDNFIVIGPEIIMSDEISIPLLEKLTLLTNNMNGIYHPNSNDQVIDLIHPSYGPYIRESKIDINSYPTSNILTSDNISKYQWLPAEFSVDKSSTKIISPIAGVIDPASFPSELYDVIADIFDFMVPMFETLLDDMTKEEPYPLSLVSVEGLEYWKPTSTDRAFLDRLILAGISSWYSLMNSKTVTLRGTNLQVITKIASIELTPENPRYKGGKWHIEGMAHENIVATGICYYAEDNLTESSLALRRAYFTPGYDDDIPSSLVFGQDDYISMYMRYGIIEKDEMNIQSLGKIITRPKRCLVFSNRLQHQVQPFELLDKSKNGYRKIIVYWLIDPKNPIKASDESFSNKAKLIHSDRLWHMKELMKERSHLVDEYTQEYFERDINLCEH